MRSTKRTCRSRSRRRRAVTTFRIGGGASDVNSVVRYGGTVVEQFRTSPIPETGFTAAASGFGLQGIVGIENAGFNADFVEPWLFDLPLRFELSGYMNQVEYDQWDEERIGVRTSLSRRIFDDFTQVTVGYKFEHVNVNHLGPPSQVLYQEQRS